MNSPSPEFLGRTGTERHLPTLPHILLKLIELCDKKPAPLQEVSRIFAKDAALTARLVGVVNFVDAGIPRRVSSIDHAVSLAGLNIVKNIVMSAAVNQVLGPGKEVCSTLELKQFWRHSLMCGVSARFLAQRISYHAPDEAYLSGLLHDVGKLLWAAHSRPHGDEPFVPSLAQGLKTAHCVAGAEMFRRWNLPSFMVDAVLYHHEPVQRVLNAFPLVKIVYVANALCSEDLENRTARYDIAEQVLGVSQNEAEECISIADKEVGQASEFFGIEVEPSGVSLNRGYEKNTQKELVRAVREILLVQDTVHDGIEARDMESLLDVIVQGIRVLFNVPNILLLVYDQEKEALMGERSVGPNQDIFVQEVVLHVRKQQSLLSECLLQDTPLDAFGHFGEVSLSILDQQILRFMGKDGMVCLPLTAHNAFLGVVVLGVDKAEAATLFEDINLLRRFTTRAASTIHAQKMRQGQVRSGQPQLIAEPSDLARKVVHEVSNPLGIIKNYLRILGLKLAEIEIGQEEIRIINEEIDRVSGIVRKLADFSKPGTQKKEFVDVNALISDLIKITHEPLLLQSNIKARFSPEPSLPPIISDRNGLKQVFINLIKNAVEAMPEGGNLYIQTQTVSDASGSPHDGPATQNAPYVEISVRDEGPGIPRSVKSSLFEPFVSSKGPGHAGLGLSIAHSIVKELHGTISCESDGGKGTTFRVVLPTEKRRTE